jgi:hypothetical protein
MRTRVRRVLPLVVVAATARLAAADVAQEQALAELAKLGPSGLPAVCERAKIGMTETELATAWPAYQPDEGEAAYGDNRVFPLFHDGRLRAIAFALHPSLEPAREYAALDKAWGQPMFVSEGAVLWVWPERHLRGSASRQFVPQIQPYAPLADLDPDARLAVTGRTVADATRVLGVAASVRGDYVTFEFAASEYGDVTVRARVEQGKLVEVALRLLYPPGALPRLLDALRGHAGLLSQDPDSKRRWHGKHVALDAGELEDFGELTITRAP